MLSSARGFSCVHAQKPQTHRRLHEPRSVLVRRIQCQRLRCSSSGVAAIAAPEAADQLTPLNNLFEDICKYHDIPAPVRLQRSTESSGVGLFAVNSIARGDTILRVPRSLCIVLDNDSGSLSIPKGDWPRLTGGIMQETALTWDLLLALALMDATAGNGDQFWELYSDHFLQQPEDLTLPLCWQDELLQELQHTAISTAAQQQQERLRTLLPPEYMQPIDQGLPSYLQWGFANVRSRALQLGPQAFGMVPFIDIANHAADPNADIRPLPPPTTATSSSSSEDLAPDQDTADQGFVELVAVKDIPAGEEVTVSYSGVSGYTNQRFMAQYGFVPAHGNSADRIEYDIPESHREITFRLSYLEEALGTQLLLDASKGHNPYLMAALKSLPLTADDPPPPPAAAAAAAGITGGSSTGRGLDPATQQEKDLAAVLMQQIQQELSSSKGSLQQDEELYRQLQQELLHGVTYVTGNKTVGGVEGVVQRDVRLAAAVKYRIERKRLLQASQVLLNIFLKE